MSPRERLKSPRLRLFVALELPQGVRDRLVAWQQGALAGRDDLRLVPRASLHVTLVFLGYQAASDVDRIVSVVFERPGPAFDLLPEGVVGVPKRRPRLYALDLEDRDGMLGGWQASVSERLRAAGLYEPEKRPFWPHVTVARMKQRKRVPAAAAPVPALPEALREPLLARQVTLYRSTLRPQGALYEPIAQLELDGD